MNSESADVLEFKMGRIGKFLIFKMAAHFRATDESRDFSNGIVMFLIFLLNLFIFMYTTVRKKISKNLWFSRKKIGKLRTVFNS